MVMAISMDMVMVMVMVMDTKAMVTTTRMCMFTDTNMGTIITTGMAAVGGTIAGILGVTSVGFGRQGDGSGPVIDRQLSVHAATKKREKPPTLREVVGVSKAQ